MQHICLTRTGDVKLINHCYDKIHEYLCGPLTFVGMIPELNIVAVGNREVGEIPTNIFCEKLGFEKTSSDIILVQTDADGNPMNIEAIKVYNFLNANK